MEKATSINKANFLSYVTQLIYYKGENYDRTIRVKS